jgi:hypothetical protein
MTNTPERQALIVIPRDSSNRIEATISRFKGKDRFDLRMYYLSIGGEWLPTQKGVAIEAKDVPMLIDALQQAQALLDEVTA